MSVVYVVQRDCMDYYCGCGGGHITGVYVDRQAAEATVPDKIFGKVTEIVLHEHRWNDEYGEGWT